MEKITDNVYVETGYNGCNVSIVVTGDGVVMVDTPQIPSEAIAWRDQIAKFGPVKYLINSEPHGDHFSGNCFFDGTIIGHEGNRAAISNASPDQMKARLKAIAPEEIAHLDNFRFLPPAITYSDRLSLYLGNHTFSLINLPGHTPFQTAVFVPEERVVITSDNLVGEGNPFFPPEALPFEWLDSLERMQNLDADIFIPGHGVVCKKSYLPEMVSLVQNRIDIVREAIKKGMSLEDAQKNISFPQKYPSPAGHAEMDKQFQRMSISRLYEVLKYN